MSPERRIHFDWGRAGAAAASGSDVLVVVDVLSFTTTTVVAVEAGAAVYPYPWDPAGAAALAADLDAVVAVGRSRAEPGQPSLSPLSLRGQAVPARLVLPSPNGSALAFALAGGGPRVVAACLRNASAVARWIAGADVAAVTVLAAGERWPDGTLRPAVEDLWGAGAVLRALAPDRTGPTPEARAAAAAFTDAAPSIAALLADSVSGRALTAKGFAGDVAVAADLDATAVVPVLRNGAFVDASTNGLAP